MSTLPTFDPQRLLPYLAPLLNAILVVLIGLAAAQLFWTVWPTSSTPVPPAAIPRDKHAPPGIDVDIDRIAAAHLFGRRSESGGDTAEIEAPETQLDLTLTGIVAESNGDGSWALIRAGSAEQDAYTIGDTIAEGVSIHAIYWNRVVLNRQGRFETLTLEIDRGDGVRRAASDEDSVNVSEQLATFRDEIVAEPALLSKYVTLKVAKRKGRIQGIRIFPTNESRKVFEEAGLKPGELVTMVNGIALDRSPDISYLTNELRDARQFTLSLERQGEQRTVTVSLD